MTTQVHIPVSVYRLKSTASEQYIGEGIVVGFTGTDHGRALAVVIMDDGKLRSYALWGEYELRTKVPQ